MSQRPICSKQANRLRKAMRSDLPAFIDLVDYLKIRRLARTTGEAEKLILDGRVSSESHKLGIGEGKKVKASARMKAALGRPLEDDDFEVVPVVDRRVPAKLRDSIQVSSA